MNWRVRIFFILVATFSFTLIEGEMGKLMLSPLLTIRTRYPSTAREREGEGKEGKGKGIEGESKIERRKGKICPSSQSSVIFFAVAI
jgi:hypothetical protein